MKAIRWFTFWKTIFYLIMAAGAYATVYRFVAGLGPSTHLSDQFPWGIWVGFDVLCGVMLAAGGFTLTGAAHILGIKRLQPIVRPTVLTAFLGYVLVSMALMVDLGRPYNIWHPLIMWNPHSVMFEVGWCVMCYTTVLALEFSPIVLERFHLHKPLRYIHAALVPIVIAGVLFSTLHQASLGSVYLIVPTKLHPFWYSPLLPFFFFISAVAVGLAMTIFESSLSSKYFGRQLELSLLKDLGRALMVVLIVYSVLRFEDLFHRGMLSKLLVAGYERNLFLLEIVLALLLPIVLLSFKRVRETPGGLYLASVSTLLGFVTNRLNVAVTGMEASAGLRYIPKWTEIAVTAAMVAGGFAIFGLAAKYLPVFPEEEHKPAPAMAPANVAAEADLVSAD
ncbi:MAG TPA: Ni/Fe-hydrogenase cytochrome b subunit [Terriglobales bacterium]|nr:Ni/Fe-hydrogenase cytochrome b subunit [Terriglobales bacterium]